MDDLKSISINNSLNKSIVSELPFAKAGLLDFDIYGAKPYRGIIQNIK